MKASVYILGLILFFTSCKPTPSAPGAQLKTGAKPASEVQLEQLAACETGQGNCLPIEVKRQSKDAKTTVRFLISTRNMQMQLFDSSYPKQMEVVRDEPIKPIIDNYIEEDGYPIIDLTSLPDGKYYVHIIGEAVGGIFELNLKTKN